jgi:hypothetical protein
MTDPRPKLVAELLAEEVRALQGAVGVLVQDVPYLTPEAVLTELGRMTEEGIDLRICYLPEGGGAAALAVGLAPDVFSAEVEQAERWRNQPGLEATIVVVATGEEARLSSLHDFELVGPTRLKGRLTRFVLSQQPEMNEVQGRWWTLLRSDSRISFTQLVDYYCALPADAVGFKTESSRELHRLGLLPDPALFDDPKEAAVRRRVELNRDLVSRLQTLTDKDRGIIAANITGEHAPDRRTALTRSFRMLQRLRRGELDDAQLTVADAQALLGIRRVAPPPAPPSPGQPEPPPPPTGTQPMAELAATALLDPVAVEDLELVVEEAVEKLNALDEPRLRPHRVDVELPSGVTVQGQAKSDVVNLVARMVGEGLYGAWVRAEGTDIEDVIRRFHGDEDVLERWTRSDIEEYLSAFDHDDAQLIATLFDAYDAQRCEILPYVRMLCAEPLTVAASGTARQKLLDYIAAYKALTEQLVASYAALFAEYGPDVDGLLAKFLTLDLIVLGGDTATTFALVTPLHPLYLWHYAEYCRVVADQRERLSERDRKLVMDAAKALPNFLTGVCLPPVASDNTLTLPQVGTLGPLPYFGTSTERNVGNDGLTAIKSLVRAFLETHPPARLGLRLTLVDPPDAGVYLSLLADLEEEGGITGGHLSVLRHPGEKPGTELGLTADEEDRVARVFRATSPGRRFTFEVAALRAEELVLPEGHVSHVLVAFDQTPGRQSRAATVEQRIQPLAMPQRLLYRAPAKTVELAPAPGGVFAAYFGVAQFLAKSPPASYFSIHQEAKLRGELQQVSSAGQWLVVADRHVDRDLQAGELRIFTGREGERDVAAFAASSDPFRRALREVARQYNTVITDGELDDLLGELGDLLDIGVLAMRPGVDGKVNHAHVKGLLGTLIAARWYRNSCPEGRWRILVSLDDPVARRWMHLREDAQRADLLGIEHGADFCALTVFEVKAVQTPSTEYQIVDGVARGPAIDQLLSTRRLLADVFGSDRDDEVMTTPARREILREHVFRELTKGRYSPDDRKRWVQVAERLFAGTMPATTLHVQLVQIHLGVDTASLGPERTVQAQDGALMVPVTITHLNESEVDALRATEPPEAPEPPDEAGLGGPPKPGDTGGAGQAEPPTSAQGAGAAPTDQGVPLDVPEHAANGEAASERAPSVTEPSARPRAFLGEAPGTYGKPIEVWFDPQRQDKPLPNPHVAITGETGSGKTQATKALLRDLVPLGLPALILDFKDDYSQVDYVETEGLRLYDASFGGLPFNPMTPPIDPRSGRASPINHIHQLSEIVKRIYRLGDQQAFHLREAMKETYTIQGVALQPFVPAEGQVYLPFEATRDVLQREGHDALLGRLSPVFDLGLFAATEETTALVDLLTEAAVIRLSQLPGDEVKNAVAEFLLMALYNHLIRQAQPRALRRLLVLDEAWRLVQSPFLEPLMREGRAFGLGVIIATQYPKDLPDTVAGATATKLFFSQTQSDQIREIQRTLVGKTSGSEAEHVASAVRSMPPLTCLAVNAQLSPYMRVDVRPYYERVPATG